MKITVTGKDTKESVPITIIDDYEVESNFVKYYAGVPYNEMTPDLMYAVYGK